MNAAVAYNIQHYSFPVQQPISKQKLSEHIRLAETSIYNAIIKNKIIMKKIFLSVLCALTLVSCAYKEEMEVFDETSLSAIEFSDSKPSATSLNDNTSSFLPVGNEKIDKKIIKNGNISIETNNLQQARIAVDGLLKTNAGYIQNEDYNDYSDYESFNLKIRIQNRYFDSFLNSLSDKNIGKITSKSVSSQDVTEDYYDTSIRLKNKELYLEKYREFLRNAKKISDMLEVQEKIRNMEEEIESAKGKLRFIDDRVNYSTIDLTLTKEKPRTAVSSKTGFGTRLVNALTSGWDLIVELVLGLISIWSILLIITAIIYVIIKLRRKKNAIKQATKINS
ncbi:MAG: DUF4349 domain-containing protein [Prevotellaceae bacterium]|jgi:hypothetical protein|nr:DUF4349 domain-containing protein [Prevotellaceae bacterium]